MDRSAALAVKGTIGTMSQEETRTIGRALGRAARPGTVIALTGELGAGKTQVAKGVADGLGVESVVNSPTFILMNEHVGRLRMYHIDAYRLADPEEAIAAGLLDDRQSDGVVVVEWADRLDGWLPVERLDIEIVARADAPTAREMTWTAHGPAHELVATEALRSR